MKHILKEGQISKLVSDKGNAGWSGEVHLIKHNGEKYVVRKCNNLERAKQYEYLSKKFEKYGFLPKFLGRSGKNVLYEYIEGRDLTKKEPRSVIQQIGQICAYINKIKVKGNINKRFEKHLSNVISHKLISQEDILHVKKLHNYLMKRVKPKMTLDANDVLADNFRLRKGKVYFVDVDSIAPRIKLFAVGKAFLKWFENPKEQKYFKEGYSSIASMNFFTKEYQDFVYLTWLIQDIYYCHLFRHKKKSGYERRVEQLRELFKTYEFFIFDL